MISHPKHCLVLVVGSRPSHPGCASLDFVNNSMLSFTGAGVAAKKMAPIWPWIGRAFRCDGTDCDAVLPDSMGPNRTWEPCGPSSPALCELGTATGGWGNAQLTVFLANSSAGLQWSKTFAQPYFVIEPVSTAEPAVWRATTPWGYHSAFLKGELTYG